MCRSNLSVLALQVVGTLERVHSCLTQLLFLQQELQEHHKLLRCHLWRKEPLMRLTALHHLPRIVYWSTLLDIMSGKTSHPDAAPIHLASRIMRILVAEICFLFPAHLLGFHILYRQSNIRRAINVAFRMRGNDSEIKTELRWRLNKYDKPSDSCATGKYYKRVKEAAMKGK